MISSASSSSSCRLSACMMGKNEEELLPQCLESIKDIVDEIIFVDTGSTDKTVEIAERYGAKVYHHPWEKDFSLHRNQSISYATGEWLLMIDCDEELCGSKHSLRKCLGEQTLHAASILIQDIQKFPMQFMSPRFFRNGKIKYEGIVHNQPVSEGDSVFIKDIFLKHYGYGLSPEKMQAKQTRTLELLEIRLVQNPEDYPVFFYMTQILGCMGQYERALEYGLKYISAFKSNPEFNFSIYYSALQMYSAIRGQDDVFSKLLKEAIDALPEDLDILYLLMHHAEKNKSSEVLRNAAERYVLAYDDYQQNPHKYGNRFVFNADLPHLALAVFHSATQNLYRGTAALNRFQKILKELPEEARADASRDMDAACSGIGIKWGVENVPNGKVQECCA